jgi:signal peptidase
VGRASGWLLLAVALLLAAAMLAPALLGYERYVITSGSMTGSFDRGSIIYDESVPVSELEVGDAITYTPPPESGKTGRLTHRIVSIGHNSRGERVFRTKGDANHSADPWKFVLRQPRQARVAFHAPYLGYAFVALSDRTTRMMVIGLPALLVALGVLIGLWREAGSQAPRPTATLAAGPAPDPGERRA